MRPQYLKPVFTLIFLFLSSLAGATPPSENWRANFGQQILSAETAAGTHPAATLGRHYILVAGLFSDYTSGSFEQTRQSLIDAGVPGENISILKVSTTQGILANISLLQSQIGAIAQAASDRKLVLVGHSLGAVSLWGAVLENQEFYLDRSAYQILLQGPFRGSPMANGAQTAAQYLEQKTAEMSGWAGWAGWALTSVAKLATAAVTEKLTPEEVQTALRTLERTHYRGFYRSVLKSRTLFLATAFNGQSLTAGNQPEWTATLCAMGLAFLGQGASDSVVTTEAQSPECADEKLRCVLPGFHHNAFTGTELGGRALARALLQLP